MASNPSDQVWLQYHRHVLATLDEPDLSLAGSLIQATETFRVMHHRSFRPTIVVRAELSDSGVLLRRRMGGRDGAERNEGIIDATHFAPVADVWRLPELWRSDRQRQLGLDGESWLCEWRVGASYRLAESWSPDRHGRDADIFRAGELLKGLAAREWGAWY